ncbi:hypothetical protein GALL_291820 [mine drainage metagenome]|uniref:Uncharacterized protein n=1 Tax=mine drainage metagenome TaxID=410659 RepID=A0A1J5RA94_9ZZZZ
MSDEVTSGSAAAEPVARAARSGDTDLPTLPDGRASTDGTSAVGPEGGTAAPPAARRPRHRVPDDAPVIPERSADDSDLGWGDGPDSNDDRLRRDVPPHW